MSKDWYLLLRKKEHKYNSFRGVSMHIQTIMCSCGGAVNNRSKFVCTVLSLNLLLVLILVPDQILGKVMSSEKGDLSSTSLPTLSSSTQTPESSEDETSDPDSFAYLDDDPVRFVNEDFVYEDEISQHHNNLYQQSLRGGNTRIALQQEKCPPLPEPSAVANSRLCEAKICQIDDNCSRDGSLVCCYNGCIHSCLPKVNPPVACVASLSVNNGLLIFLVHMAAYNYSGMFSNCSFAHSEKTEGAYGTFDWVEETELKKFSKEENEEENISPKTLLAAELRPDTVALPGGCHLESEQYQDLIMFRKLNHVKTCTCTQGEVVCEVLHEELDS